MTEPGPEPQPGTAVAKTGDENSKLLEMAKTPQERAFAFEHMARRRQEQMVRRAAQEIALLSWGKELSQAARAAIAFFAYECGTNPVTHWIVLGGNLYDTSALWFDLATSQPDYVGYDVQHINDDERLEDQERQRRRALRAEHNVPEDVKGACIVTIWKRLPDGQKRAFTGVNHAGNRQGFNARKGAEGLIKDPIGEQDPGKTAETRAFRRAAKRCWPIWRFKREIPENEGLNLEELGREKVSNMLTEERERTKALEAQGITNRMGDRLPIESVQLTERGYPGARKQGPVEGVESVPDPYMLIDDELPPGEVALVCPSCGNYDSLPADVSPTPECSAGCGARMRAMTSEEIHERAIRREDAELARE